jgi:hypothetical protein
VHRGDRETVTSDADEPHETLVARLDRRLERATVPRAVSHSMTSTRLCSWIKSTWLRPSRLSNRRMLSFAPL